MRALVQRVLEASVVVENRVVGQIGPGLCVFLGIHHTDSRGDAEKLVSKLVKLRVFPDDEGKMNRSLSDVSGELLVISQFTLYADTSRGNRPSYSQAADPQTAKSLYDAFVEFCAIQCARVATGVFQAHMQVSLVNDGPVTFMCYSGE